MSQNEDHTFSISIPSYTVRKSFVKVTSSSSDFTSPMITRDLSEENERQTVVLKSRSESPHSLLRLKFCDNSSGYSSATSLSSISHSPTKSPTTMVHSQSSIAKFSLSSGERPNKAYMIKESITNILDQIDMRVSFLKETASELEEEKKKLSNVLNSITSCKDLQEITEVEQEEIRVTTDCLLYRLNSVEIMIFTPRNETQEKALEIINDFVDLLSNAIKTNRESAKLMCESYLNACSSEREPIDVRFQKAIIECAADDQKRIRKRLEGLYLAMQKSNS